FDDRRGRYSFRQVDYDVVQHLPVLRDAWVLSVRARAETTLTSGDDTVPFFMMPTLGNGTTLRGFASGRFRDRQSLLVSGEWRVLVNSVIDAAVFYDAGKVAARRRDLDLRGLERSYGVGVRLHTFTATPLRFDVARSRDGLVFVVGATAAF
ncbi:MAG: BamA/TamA family outer membrane protein, partial [Acidobacteria bacterium]|nr:BamA/TamA family outer membrane protein [Acidobacteriota bacterium]